MFRKTLFLAAIAAFSFILGEEKKPVRVYADVVGDLCHSGHFEFFKKAKELGDILIIGVLPDDIVEDYKRRPILTLEERAKAIAACRYVDVVIRNCPLGITEEWMNKYEIDLVVHGDDFNMETAMQQYEPAIRKGIFKTVPYTEGISTTDIIHRILERRQNGDSMEKKGG